MNRLCYVIPSLNTGGTERQLLYLIEGLVKDHEITVVCTREGGSFIGEASRLGADVRVVQSWGGWDLTLRWRLRKLFRRHRPDIVHTFLFGFDYAANRAARDTGVPVAISSRRELAVWQWPRHVRLQRRANKHVDCIVANSRAAAEYAQQKEAVSPSLFRVIPNGIHADTYVSATDLNHLRVRFDIPFHTHVVGTVANFSPVKDYPLFLKMAEELMSRRDDLHFLLVGAGPQWQHVAHVIRARGWGDRFTRVASVNEIPDLLRLMSVFVLCSKVEGFPNAIMEAMAARKPVVVPATGGIPELVRDHETGLLVESRDAQEFADAIEYALDHPEDAEAMAARAGDFVRRELTVDAMVEAYRKLYTELLAEAFRPSR